MVNDKKINNLEIDNKIDSLQAELNKTEDKICYLKKQIEDLSLEKEELTKKNRSTDNINK